MSTPPIGDERTSRPAAEPATNGAPAPSQEAPPAAGTEAEPLARSSPATNGAAPAADGATEVDRAGAGAEVPAPPAPDPVAVDPPVQGAPAAAETTAESPATEPAAVVTPAIEAAMIAPPADEPVQSLATAAPPEVATPSADAMSVALPAETAAPPAEQAPPPPPPDIPTAGDGGPPQPEGEEEEEGMTMLEHLEELRVRVIIICTALALGLAFASVPWPGYSTWTGHPSITWHVIAVVNAPAQGYLQALKPGEIFITYFKVAMVVGAAIAMPVMIYQIMKFVIPALYAHERKYLFMAAPGVTISFVLGIFFGYMLLLPFAINFLLNFGVAESGVDVKWAFGEYIGTVTTLLFWMGMAFETPLIMFFLTKLRVISVERLIGFRKYALICAFILGAMITPTPDPLNQTIVSVPLYLLFELGILMAKLA